MLQSAAFHQGQYFLLSLKLSSEKELQSFLEIITYDIGLDKHNFWA